MHFVVNGEAVPRLIPAVREELTNLGLVVNPRKTQLWAPGGLVDLPETTQQFLDLATHADGLI
eukprot:5345242-Prorocentrum_lima.AAC.1